MIKVETSVERWGTLSFITKIFYDNWALLVDSMTKDKHATSFDFHFGFLHFCQCFCSF